MPTNAGNEVRGLAEVRRIFSHMFVSLKLTADGLVDFHRDYRDAAEELYEKLPLLGGLMRWLRKRANQ